MSQIDPESNPRPVFHDPKGGRRRFVNYFAIIAGGAVSVLIAVFVVSVLVNPFLPQVRLKPLAALPQSEDTGLPVPERPATSRKELQVRRLSERIREEKARREELKLIERLKREAEKSARRNNQSGSVSDRRLSVGFFVNWDDSSFASLQQNIKSLDWLVPEWIRLSGDPNDPLVLDIDQKAMQLIQAEKPDLRVLPLLQNYKNEQWDAGLISKSLMTAAARQKVIESLLKVIEENKFGGLTIDIEEVPADKQAALLAFVNQLHSEFSKRGLVLAQAVPFDNPDWDYKAFAAVTDYLMLMAYDQHWATGQPGSIAGQDWFETILKKRMAELAPEKTIICFGNYGYDWVSGKSEAEDISFQQAVLAAKESLDSPSEIKFAAPDKNPHFSYTEDDGRDHTIWFLDAVTAFNQIKAAEHYRIGGLALWRLGSEDPSVWKIFGSGRDAADPNAVATIKYGYDVDFEGTGEILQVIAEPQDGLRLLQTDNGGQITNEIYQTIPSSYVIRRTGDRPGKIVLTFDDGPDPKWTPQILDILARENVKAAFFIVGQNGQANPDLVKRIVAEGHEIGNHSFTHPNLGEVPRQITELELNTTQRLIESLTGRSTRLFRAPYFGDAEPRTPDEIVPTVQAQNLGYISVGLHLDPADWKMRNDDGTPHTADQIVDEVIRAAAIRTPEERGSIVLLHDSGGDRSATVAALPRIIEELRARGYQFTTISDLAGISADESMPPVANDQSFYSKADAYVFYGLSIGGWALRWLFLLGIVFGIGRMIVIGILAFAQFIRSKRRAATHFGEQYQPKVSVVVPAYNEEKVIVRTIESLLRSDYPDFEIIVVDDGSSDNTYTAATEAFGENPLVRIYRKENGGKAAALNFGWRKAYGEVIIALDADTLFTPTTIAALAHRFADKRIGAVAGNAKVGNRINIVTKWQALEYVTSQNFDRRAFSSLNCITVVPGSVGAWRREVLEEVGGFSSDTLAEDQDLTIEVIKRGHKIGYEENAIGLTEAPDSLRNLARQRYRWSFGTLQCMWKHKDALLNPKYGTLGFIAMPNVWIFQVFFPLISPLMDLVFIWTMISAAISAFEHQQEYAHTPVNLDQVVFYYALFLAIDWFGAFAAFMMEKREDKKLLGWLLLQRFGYRQVMYWVMVKSVFTAIRGAFVGWGKLERKATVAADA